MPDREKVMLGLECCLKAESSDDCVECPYFNGETDCVRQKNTDALALLREYDTALKLMVLQYCTLDDGFYHRFMSAGEEAFRVLGIENGQSTNGVWEKWFQNNERGEDNA